MKTVKILLFNLAYGTLVDGSVLRYLFNSHRILFKTANNFLAKLASFVRQQNSDICCLTEIKKDFYSAKNFTAYPYYDITNKYGRKSLLKHLFIFRQCCNGFWAKENLAAKKLYFSNGTKKLIYDIEIGGNAHLIFAHFSLNKNTRQKQLQQLQQIIIKDPRPVIIGGDFNLFNGRAELKSFLENAGLIIASETVKPTFPSYRPQKELDLFICSKGIKVLDYQVIPIDISDHLPVMLEVTIDN